MDSRRRCSTSSCAKSTKEANETCFEEIFWLGMLFASPRVKGFDFLRSRKNNFWKSGQNTLDRYQTIYKIVYV